MVVTLLTFQLERSWLKAEANQNTARKRKRVVRRTADTTRDASRHTHSKTWS